MSEKKSINAVAKIRKVFESLNKPLTLRDIGKELPDLRPCDISMALCYLHRQKYATREPIPNDGPRERKNVWLYSYSQKKIVELQSAD